MNFPRGLPVLVDHNQPFIFSAGQSQNHQKKIQIDEKKYFFTVFNFLKVHYRYFDDSKH